MPNQTKIGPAPTIQLSSAVGSERKKMHKLNFSQNKIDAENETE